jgi:sialate O-acetylesterase
VNKPGEPGTIDGWGLMRLEQIAALAMIKKTAAAVTYDVSDYVSDNRNRQDAAERLARGALALEYGKKIVASGPTYKSHRVEGDRVVISFDHLGGGLIVGEKNGLAPLAEVKNGKLAGFAIAGEDKKWHWAEAKIEGDTVVLRSENVPAPVAVRYAVHGNPMPANLYNRDGLPAVPFRTDSW